MPGMNSRNKTKVIRDVSCTSSLDCDSELRGAEPNPLDFGCVMEKIRRKTFFFSKVLPSLVILVLFFSEFIVMSERQIFLLWKKKKTKERAENRILEINKENSTAKIDLFCIPQRELLKVNIQHTALHSHEDTASN